MAPALAIPSRMQRQASKGREIVGRYRGGLAGQRAPGLPETAIGPAGRATALPSHGLGARLAPEARQVVRDRHPGRAVVEVEVRLRRVARALEVREYDVEVVRMQRRLAEERAAAAAAEAPGAVLGRPVADQPLGSGDEAEALVRDSDPRDVTGAMGATA